jgi:hypothetical protein
MFACSVAAAGYVRPTVPIYSRLSGLKRGIPLTPWISFSVLASRRHARSPSGPYEFRVTQYNDQNTLIGFDSRLDSSACLIPSHILRFTTPSSIQVLQLSSV